jgi:hypothetical protein
VAAAGHTGGAATGADTSGVCFGALGTGGVPGFTGVNGWPALNVLAALAGSAAPGARTDSPVVTDSTSPNPTFSPTRRRAMYPTPEPRETKPSMRLPTDDLSTCLIATTSDGIPRR